RDGALPRQGRGRRALGADAARLRPRDAGAVLRHDAPPRPRGGRPPAPSLVAARRVSPQRGSRDHGARRRPRPDAPGGGARAARRHRDRPGAALRCARPPRRGVPDAVLRALRGGRRGPRGAAVNVGRFLPDLLATLGRAPSPDVAFARTIRQLVTLSGARSGGLTFEPRRGVPVVVTAGARRGSALDHWLRARLAQPVRAVRVERVDPPPGRRGAKPVVLRAPLGHQAAPVGRLLLLGPGGRRGLAVQAVPPSFPRELGLALERTWRLHQRTLRLEVVNEVTALSARTVALEPMYRTVAEAVGR